MHSESYDLSLAPIKGPLRRRRIRSRRLSKLGHALNLAVAIALSLGVCALAVFLVWRVPHWLDLIRSVADPKDRLNLENEILKNLIQMLGGAFLLAGLYFTWKNLMLAREGQITDRFTKAIDHLGSEKLEIRLGGIYSLARIARDSLKDHWPTMEILCAFVRDRSHARESSSLQLAVDIQAVLNVLSERSFEVETDDECLDLTTANLAGANFRGANLERARFDDARLDGADFMNASLRQSDFRGASLRAAHLREAQLDGANLTAANLQDASLRLAKLGKANLFGTNLHGATLIGADLSEARFMTKDQIASAIWDETTQFPTLLE
jgi:hypothetical protein